MGRIVPHKRGSRFTVILSHEEFGFEEQVTPMCVVYKAQFYYGWGFFNPQWAVAVAPNKIKSKHVHVAGCTATVLS